MTKLNANTPAAPTQTKVAAAMPATMVTVFGQISDLSKQIVSKGQRLVADADKKDVEQFRREDLAKELRSIELLVSRLRLRVRELKLEDELRG